MTTYVLRNNPGCVVHEYRAYQVGVDKTPLRETLSAVDTVQFTRDDAGNQIMKVYDMTGALSSAWPGDYLVQKVGDYMGIHVHTPEEFAENFEVAREPEHV